MTNAPVKKVPIHLQSSQNRLLIKNGRVVNDDGMEDLDVYIEDGIIKQIGRNLIIPGGTRTIDATGKLVMPGGIDPHTHFELEMMGAKSADDFYKGTRAAVAGGTTCVIDFVLPNKGQSLLEAYANWREKADNKVCCDYGLHVGITWWSPSVKKEMQQLTTEQYGVNSFKMFMAYMDCWMLNDYELYCAFESCAELKALPMVHAENGYIIARNTEKLLAKGITGPEGHMLSRDEEVEGEAVNRACVIANQANTPLYVVHMMSKSAVRAMQLARTRQRQPLFGETLAATVGTDGSQYRNACFRHAAAHVLSPPLRPDPSTPQAMCEALADDHLQLIGSDNCTFHEKEKELGKGDFSKIPNGVNGVEDRMTILWQKAVNTGIMDPCRFVSVTSSNAAKIFNVFPQKGRIAVNSDADIVVWDPKLEKTISAASHKQAVNFNIFEGQHVVGGPQYVIVNGRVCLDDGELRVVEGFGRFLKTPVDSPAAFGDQADKEEALHTPDFLDLPAHVNGTPSPDLGNLNNINKSVESLSVSGCSTPTGRKMREPGQRNLQTSTFSISKEVEGLDTKTSVRVRNPPGGKSSGLCDHPHSRLMERELARNQLSSTFSESEEMENMEARASSDEENQAAGMSSEPSAHSGLGDRESGQNQQTSTFAFDDDTEISDYIASIHIKNPPAGMTSDSCEHAHSGLRDRESGRNQQTSTFSVSEEIEGMDTRASIHVQNPAAGMSSEPSAHAHSGVRDRESGQNQQTSTFAFGDDSEISDTIVSVHSWKPPAGMSSDPSEHAHSGLRERESGRNQQTSTFSISEEIEGMDTKPSIHILEPAAGMSSEPSAHAHSGLRERETGQNQQTSTFSISKEMEAEPNVEVYDEYPAAGMTPEPCAHPGVRRRESGQDQQLSSFSFGDQ